MVGQRFGELAGGENLRTNVFDEGCIGGKGATWVSVLRRRENSHFFAEVANGHLNGAEQIRVIRNYDSAFIIVFETVHQHLRRQVYIGTFFLRADDIHISLSICERHVPDVREKRAEDDLEVGRGSQRAQVGFLPLAFLGIAWARFHQCGEIVNAPDLVTWQKNAAQGGKIKPFVGRAFDRAVIEIETVYVHVCDHGSQFKNRDRREAVSHRVRELLPGGMPLLSSEA